jgi:hypothetical protein
VQSSRGADGIALFWEIGDQERACRRPNLFRLGLADGALLD